MCLYENTNVCNTTTWCFKYTNNQQLLIYYHFYWVGLSQDFCYSETKGFAAERFHNCNFKNVSIINNTSNSELILSSVVSFVKMGLLLRSHPWSINMSWVVNFYDPKYVTRHEKIGLMCTKYTPLHYSTYLPFCVSYTCSVNCIKFSSSYWTICKSFIDKLCSGTKLWNFKVQKSGHTLCAHKPMYITMNATKYHIHRFFTL